ncbi:MAG: 16S rRNA (cytosine(1402)-N(4))-methyltransferase RsmH [bacterium]|nr:16S rRNA (cytosine(1402)-N(4))-methyltransferase RsmH [bacterium]
MKSVHAPVLLQEVIRLLDPKVGQNFIDCTLGGAGHALAIAEAVGPKGKVLGIDWDARVVKEAKTLKRNVHVVQGNFADLESIVRREKFSKVNGILLDLGFSSDQLESGRGFSFLKDEPLDMRYDMGNPLQAKTILNYWSRQDIERVLKEYGEEKFATDITEAITRERSRKSIEKTGQLVRIIEDAVPKKYLRGSIHVATRTFQALRIAVNSELENLKNVLPQAVRILSPRGRIAVICFHSLEDRIVKQFFKGEPSLTIITKKPVTPRDEEIRINRRSRSAKLRVAQKQ